MFYVVMANKEPPSFDQRIMVISGLVLKGYTCISVLKCEILCENKKESTLSQTTGVGRSLLAYCEQT